MDLGKNSSPPSQKECSQKKCNAPFQIWIQVEDLPAMSELGKAAWAGKEEKQQRWWWTKVLGSLASINSRKAKGGEVVHIIIKDDSMSSESESVSVGSHCGLGPCAVTIQYRIDSPIVQLPYLCCWGSAQQTRWTVDRTVIDGMVRYICMGRNNNNLLNE